MSVLSETRSPNGRHGVRERGRRSGTKTPAVLVKLASLYIGETLGLEWGWGGGWGWFKVALHRWRRDSVCNLVGPLEWFLDFYLFFEIRQVRWQFGCSQFQNSFI